MTRRGSYPAAMDTKREHAPTPKMFEGEAEPFYDDKESNEEWESDRDKDAPEPAGQHGEAMGTYKNQHAAPKAPREEPTKEN